MPRTPRVAITLTQCWHEVPGGTATSVQRLVDELARSQAVELVGVGARGELRRPRSLWRDEPPGEWRSPIELERLPLPLPILYDAWTRTGRPRIVDTTGPVDLVHLTVPITPPADDVPLVATVHDLFPLTRPAMMTARGAGLMAAGLDAIRERASRIMVPSHVVARDCERHGIDPDRLRVVPWGVSPVDVDESDVARVRARHGLRGPYVLFVGTLEPRKNLAGLLDAMVELSRAEVTLVLVGPPGWGDAFGGTSGVGVGDVPSPVVALGHVPGADLAALQHGAEVCCVPSLAEGFGLPVLEAMAAGAAVLTSSGTATAEVAGDAAVLVDPTDPGAIARGLGDLLDDAAHRDELRRRGRVRSQDFTWRRAAEATLEVYHEALR